MNFYRYEYAIPTRTLFGPGRLNELHNQPMPGKKALLVISNGKSAKSNGSLARTEDQLRQAGVESVAFDKIEPNPTMGTVNLGGKIARENGCDFVVALGGGSCIDASKGIAAMAVNDGELWDYVLFGTGKRKPIPNKPLPLIAITTTAGTGSETDAGGVITNPETNEKTGFFHPEGFPTLAIVDPELTLSVPPKWTAYQGFDALFHSVEGFVAPQANLMSDIYALAAIESVARYLPVCVRDGSDLDARTRVSWANTLSGAVMCLSSCNSEHSLEHALSAFHPEMSHGAGLIMICKAYFEHFIEKHCCDGRYIRMAQAMGKPDADDPKDFIVVLERLMEECGVADLKMSDYGVTPDEFPKFAVNARETTPFLYPGDRVPLTDEDAIAIYAASYK